MPEKSPREIHLKSEKGEIDVFLCPDEISQTTCDPLLDDLRPYVGPIVEKYLSPRNMGPGKQFIILYISVVGLTGLDSLANPIRSNWSKSPPSLTGPIGLNSQTGPIG